MLDSAIARIRRFNRAVTREIGVCDSSFLGRGRPLGAARVLHMATPEGMDVATIRETLDLDSGLLSRLLRGLEAEGLLTTEPHPQDGRRRVARLTAKGVAEKAEYERLSDDHAARTLARAPRMQAELLAAMDLVATILDRDHVEIRRTDPDDPAALATIGAYSRFLARKIPDEGPRPVPLPMPDAAAYRPPRGAVLVALSDGAALGCVSLRSLSPGLGEIKRLWVAHEARGQGLARRLMRAAEDQARALGMTRLKLDTNAALTEALALYRAEGWVDTEPYSSYPATHWFTKVL